LGCSAGPNWWDKLAASLRIEIIYADSDITGEAIALLKHYRDQRISLTDAVSFKIMERHAIREAFTFDSHFSTAGFIKLPY
jgi:uncharacterized protein